MPIPESQATPQEALAPRARWALASLSLAMLMPSLDTSIANAALPSLAQTLEAVSYTHLTLPTTPYV